MRKLMGRPCRRKAWPEEAEARRLRSPLVHFSEYVKQDRSARQWIGVRAPGVRRPKMVG
jgi:hypothetical protein